jgi:hypothetical protein
MSGWAGDELDRIADVDELQLASVRRDGTLGRPVTIWVVRHGDDLFVRSWRGRTSRWFRGVQDRHQGHIRAGGVDKDVTFDAVDAGDDVNDAVDAAYRSKYRRYPDSIVDSMLHPQARATTLKLVPRATGD